MYQLCRLKYRSVNNCEVETVYTRPRGVNHKDIKPELHACPQSEIRGSRGGNPRVISRSCIATSQLMLMNFPRQAIAILLFFKGIAIARRTLRGMRPE